jgi:hypothetical protein
MTSVYSGGLVYEYTQEDSKFGLVEVQGNQVKELADFAVLKSAFAKTPAPTDDGGYKADNKPSDCPLQTNKWLVTNNSLPIMPSGAQKYFENGAGTGVGIKTGDKGSQWAGQPSSGWADAKVSDSPGNVTSKNKNKSSGSQNSTATTFMLLGLAITAALVGSL